MKRTRLSLKHHVRGCHHSSKSQTSFDQCQRPWLWLSLGAPHQQRQGLFELGQIHPLVVPVWIAQRNPGSMTKHMSQCSQASEPRPTDLKNIDPTRCQCRRKWRRAQSTASGTPANQAFSLARSRQTPQTNATHSSLPKAV